MVLRWFFDVATIAFNGFRWFWTIGQTMRWFRWIVVVYTQRSEKKTCTYLVTFCLYAAMFVILVYYGIYICNTYICICGQVGSGGATLNALLVLTEHLSAR